MTVRGHQLGIDWSQNGTYAGALEDASSYVLPGDIEIGWGRDATGDVTLSAPSGQMRFALRNDTMLFNSENSSSPIFGKVLPNRKVKYEVTHLGTTYRLLFGVLDVFDTDGDPVGVFTANTLDGWGRPGGERLSTALYRGIRTGDAINIILDAIGWTRPRDIDAGATYMPFWWEEGTDARTAIDKLVASEGAPAIAYVEGGTFVFKDRHHRLFDARSTTSQGTFTHTIPASVVPGDFKIEAGSFRYNHGVQRIINSATIPVEVRATQPVAEVWSSDDPVVIAAGQSIEIPVQSSTPFHSALLPTTGNVDSTADIRVQSGGGTIGVSLSRTSGQAATLFVTCSVDTVLARVAIRANPVAATRTVQVTASDAGSIGNFGTQALPDACIPVWANVYDAQVIATRAVGIYANYRPTIEFTIVGLNDTYLAEMLQAKISDRITIRNDARGINADYMIERLSHRITSLGVIHRLTITCEAAEPAQAVVPFTFDVAGRGFNQGAFVVAGMDVAASMFRFDTAGAGFNQGQFAN